MVESSDKLHEHIKTIQSICEDNCLTVEVNSHGEPALVLHYYDDKGEFTWVSKKFETTPF